LAWRPSPAVGDSQYDGALALEIVYAVEITPEGQRKLRDAAGIENSDWFVGDYPEPEVRDQALKFAGRDFNEVVGDADIAGRRPYLWASCGGTFTVQEYREVKGTARRRGELNPFLSDRVTHSNCP
jgi:hypothetical protein